MRLFYLLVVAFAVSLSPAIAASESAANGFKSIVPSKFDRKVEIRVSGKVREYYALQQGQSIEISVTGPAKMRLLSRAVLASGKDEMKYAYTVNRLDGGKDQTIRHSAPASESAAFAGELSGTLSESRSKIVDVPRGPQVYTLTLQDFDVPDLFFRVFVNTNEFYDGSGVVAMTPNSFTTEVPLLTNEETVVYYRVGRTDHVRLSLVGPATLKVITRVEFDSTMIGEQRWKVQVNEDGMTKATYNLSASKSDVSLYKGPSSLVPSAGETFYIEIPRGEHAYEFTLPENHRTALLRCLLPKSQLERK